MAATSTNIAVFIDLENVAIGVREAKLETFKMDLVMARLLDKGNVIVRKAYADWGRFAEYKRPLHDSGVELTDMPSSTSRGKNSADIKMVVDALELSFTKPHIDTFALISGDSDFSPLVAKLRENNRYTIGVGVKASTSRILINACDEFIIYDDLARGRKKRSRGLSRLPEESREAFELLLESVAALQREGRNMHSSLVKETMKRKQPQFSEEFHGYSSFNKLLEEARKRGLIELAKDPKSGTWVVTEVSEATEATEPTEPTESTEEAAAPKPKRSTRKRTRKKAAK
ncbi:MAG: hypothetical protein DRQ55_14355 [Planctomycetota bacterium]|nr:MAG: hypothetical protein DRQ55_14355 [Planctomycetota bacterium]